MKETKIEKLILNLSNRWDCSPQEAVDRLNSMNESEINKLINSMTKKFLIGGLVKPPIQPRFVAPARSDMNIQQPAPSASSSKLLTAMMGERKNEAQKLMEQASDLRSKQYADFLKQQEINKSTYSKQNMNRIMKNGGFIDCLREGGKTYVECKKCGGKTPVEKHQVPGQHLGEKHEYYRPSLFRQIFKAFSKNPQYQREDGLGTYSGEIKHNGDTVTVVTGPYTTFEEIRTPKGERFIDSYGKDWMNRTYAPNSSSRGWSRNPADPEEVEMFDNIRKRFK